MIKYELRCRGCDHQFEGWFADSTTYDDQAAAGVIECPFCMGSDVGKAIMAPNIAVRRRDAAPPMSEARMKAEIRRMVLEVRRHVESNCDYVGDAFAAEARKMHYGETDERGIYGETTPDEAQELQEEGIDVVAIPWVRDDA